MIWKQKVETNIIIILSQKKICKCLYVWDFVGMYVIENIYIFTLALNISHNITYFTVVRMCTCFS